MKVNVQINNYSSILWDLFMFHRFAVFYEYVLKMFIGA